MMITHALRLSLYGLLLGTTSLFAQEKQTLSLRDVQASTKEHYPLLKQQQVYKQLQSNKWHENAMALWPQLSVTGQATYQSEVTKFNLPGGGSTGFQQKPDQYALGLEMKKTLNDWGYVKQQQQLDYLSGELQRTQVDVEWLKLKDRVNAIYGNLLFLQENKQILELRLRELEARGKKVKSAVDQGAALKSSYLIIESEKISTQQKLEEIRYNRQLGCSMLAILTQLPIDTNTVLTSIEDDRNPSKLASNRPEAGLFSLQAEQLQTREKLLKAVNLPKVFVFGRAYYGRPGFNFLNNEFRPYGLAGVGLSWNLSAYYTFGKEKEDIALNRNLVDAKREEFELNLQSDLLQKMSEMNKLHSLIQMDKTLVLTKAEIRRSAASQLDNGVITPSDFLVELNAETQAQLNQTLHEIQWMMAKENYLTALGL